MPYGALPQVGKDYAQLMKGKIVIDVGNPRVDRDGEVGKDGLARGTGVTSKEHLPGVRLVRALNALSFTQVTKEAHRAGEKLGIPIAADDQEAIAVTVRWSRTPASIRWWSAGWPGPASSTPARRST